jgi:hypothetical protein
MTTQSTLAIAGQYLQLPIMKIIHMSGIKNLKLKKKMIILDYSLRRMMLRRKPTPLKILGQFQPKITSKRMKTDFKTCLVLSMSALLRNS